MASPLFCFPLRVAFLFLIFVLASDRKLTWKQVLAEEHTEGLERADAHTSTQASIPSRERLIEFLEQHGWRTEWFGNFDLDTPLDVGMYDVLGDLFPSPSSLPHAIFGHSALKSSFPVAFYEGKTHSDVGTTSIPSARTVTKHVFKIQAMERLQSQYGIEGGARGPADSVQNAADVPPARSTSEEPRFLLRGGPGSSTAPGTTRQPWDEEIVVAIHDVLPQRRETEGGFGGRISSEVRQILTNSAVLLMHGRAALALAVLENLDDQVLCVVEFFERLFLLPSEPQGSPCCRAKNPTTGDHSNVLPLVNYL